MPRLSSQRSESSRSSIVEDLNILSMEPAKIEKLRRWILALVIGKLIYVSPFRVLIYFVRAVDFDLDYGPKIACVYPPLDLEPAEAENMYATTPLLHSFY